MAVGKDCSNWIKDRIDQYDSLQNQDFVVFANSGENYKGGRLAKEYAVTLDMAKELFMVERNEEGKQAHQYFECERRAKDAANRDAVELLNDLAAMRGLLQHYSEKIIQLETVVKKQQPKVEALDRVATANGSLCVTDVAKVLQVLQSDHNCIQVRR